MAGTVAKVPYHNKLGDGPYMKHTTLVGNMEENVILNYLNDQSFDKRAEVLEQLRIAVRKNGGRLLFANRLAIFKGLALALGDSNWDVRHQCIQLIHEVIPQFGDDLDMCMSQVLPKLIPNMGDIKITIRRSVIQTLHVYMKFTDDIQIVFHAIVNYGLENNDAKIRKETIIALPMLFTPEFAHENLFEVTQSLVKRLVDSSSANDNIQPHAILSLEKIKNLVGTPHFDSYIQQLSPPLRRYYLKITNNEDDFYDEPLTTSHSTAAPVTSNMVVQEPWTNYAGRGEVMTAPANFHDGSGYEFGVIPVHVMQKLYDQSNFRTRAQGVEDLRVIISELNDVALLSPHLLHFISFLNNLLDDPNFKITTVTLDILGLLVEKLNIHVEPHLKPLILALSKRMGDNKIVVRQSIMKVVRQLMQLLSPKPVLAVICENLSHRNSRVRQETLNIIIASLLTFPSYDFDLGPLCQTIAHTLVDSKRQVRQAALECFAVLASAMGAGRLQPLVQAVDSVELSYDGDGVMVAVQARLAKRQLPKLNSDGLVDYAAPIPSSASTRGNSSIPHGADIEWILAASGGAGSSARSTRSDTLELESVTSSSARSSPANFITDVGPTPRRHLSATKKGRLPWEDEDAESMNGHNDLQSGTRSERGTLKSRTTWGGEQMVNTIDSDRTHNGVMRRQASTDQHRPSSRDNSPESGSYRQLYMNKYKRQMSDNLPFSVYNAGRDEEVDIPSSFTTPRDDHGFHSNTWPDSRAFDEKGTKKRLDPISGMDVDFSDMDCMRDGRTEKSPVPLKPALARGTGNSKRKVPPINTRDDMLPDEDMLDSARDSVLDGTLDDDDGQAEMLNSLRQIRNSATKKKAEKIFSRLEQETFGSNSGRDSPDESGIFSSSSRGGQDEVDLSRKKGRNKPEPDPFESRPRLARKASIRDMRENKENARTTPEAPHLDFNPLGGVTFRDNPSSDVAIVGRGYGEDSVATEPRPNIHANKPRDKPRRVNSFKGALEVTSSVSDHSVPERHGRRPSRPELQPSDLPKGVYGIGVSKSTMEKGHSDEEDEELGMPRPTQEPMTRKTNKQRDDPADRRPGHYQRRGSEDRRRKEEELQRERERQQEKLRRLSNQTQIADDLQIANVRNSPAANAGVTNGASPTKPPAARPIKRRSKPQVADEYPAETSPPANNDDSSGDILRPMKDPSAGLNDGLKKMGGEDWEVKCNGLNTVRRVVIHHPEVMLGQLHTITLAVIGEVKNLRSQVSRIAIVCLGEMFCNLKKHMEPDLEQTTRLLLAKTGDSNGFIRADVESSLAHMVENITPQRAMLALIAGGASHRNTAVRKTAAMYLVTVVEKMGPGRILSGVKDITDKVLPVAANFMLDGSPETRYHGQRIFYMLMSHEDFEKMLNKYVNASTLRNIQDRLDSLKKKGLGDPPSETPSARARRSGQGSRSSSVTRGSSASSTASDSPAKPPSSMTRRARVDDGTMEDIKTLCTQMSANDWRERHKGLVAFSNMVDSNPEVVKQNIIKIFDKFVPCVKDSNSKVNVYALQVLLAVTPVLGEAMAAAINLTVQTTANNLSSKNKEIYDTAGQVLDMFMEQLDGSILLQPFANQAQAGNARIKPDMIERVAFLVTQVYRRKPKQVVLHILPLLWHLLASQTSGGTPSNAAVKSATGLLVTSLHSLMGASLLEHASSNSNVTPKMKQLLQDMIDNP